MEDLPAFQALQDFRADLSRRAWELRGKEQELTNELAGMEARLDEAIVLGTHRAVQTDIDRLRAELAPLQREIQVLENPPPGGKLGALVKSAWGEAVSIITVDLRGEWNTEVVELEKAKAMFLKSVGTLGAIKRRADSLSSRITETMMAVPGPKLAAPALATGIISRPDRHEGFIFMDHLGIAKTFNGRN